MDSTQDYYSSRLRVVVDYLSPIQPVADIVLEFRFLHLFRIGSCVCVDYGEYSRRIPCTEYGVLEYQIHVVTLSAQHLSPVHHSVRGAGAEYHPIVFSCRSEANILVVGKFIDIAEITMQDL